jgi:hypothetical protein
MNRPALRDVGVITWTLGREIGDGAFEAFEA